jgi:lipopolysaccharide export system ATP-binding protein
MSEAITALVQRLTGGDRSAALCLLAITQQADENGHASFANVVMGYRSDYLEALDHEGRDTQSESGRLSSDEVRAHVTAVVIPRLVAAGAIAEQPSVFDEHTLISLIGEARDAATTDDVAWRAALRDVAEHVVVPKRSGPIEGGSVLAANGLVKTYKKRNVVNNVAVELRQGEIVGLLGPNGAGKTTTFYQIAGLIPPDAGRITLDGEDITHMPMFKRARRGIGYLSQEPSIFRKLSVEENVLAILETLPITKQEQQARLETLLDELKIKHLRHSKAFALSGGERRRLEITRALVTEPKFMMLDEPFAGVDPIAVHDIQGIVASLKDRGIGVLISDHNVEQTLDIVDRAYIMFDGQVKVSGPVRDLIFDDTVATIYFGPTLTARLRARFTEGG